MFGRYGYEMVEDGKVEVGMNDVVVYGVIDVLEERVVWGMEGGEM